MRVLVHGQAPRNAADDKKYRDQGLSLASFEAATTTRLGTVYFGRNAARENLRRITLQTSSPSNLPTSKCSSFSEDEQASNNSNSARSIPPGCIIPETSAPPTSSAEPNASQTPCPLRQAIETPPTTTRVVLETPIVNNHTTCVSSQSFAGTKRVCSPTLETNTSKRRSRPGIVSELISPGTDNSSVSDLRISHKPSSAATVIPHTNISPSSKSSDITSFFRIAKKAHNHVQISPSISKKPLTHPPSTPIPTSPVADVEIKPPSPPTGHEPFSSQRNTGLFPELRTKYPLYMHFRPRSMHRGVEPLERGYWRLDTSRWSAKQRDEVWLGLRKDIEAGVCGWSVYVSRLAELFDRSIGEDHGGVGEIGLVWKVFCWGDLLGEVFVLLDIISDGAARGIGAEWVDAEGRVVVEMD